MTDLNGARVSTQTSEEHKSPINYEPCTNSIKEKPQNPQDLCQAGLSCKPPDHKGE